jgi:inositol-hexakisphosphate/diphosphoinositol-pentakisphosphate 1-kinase
MQKIFWDRRAVLAILDILKVPTPERLVVNKKEDPILDPQVCIIIKAHLGIDLSGKVPISQVSYDEENEEIVVDNKRMKKPFVEKPVDGENHNIYIYFSKAQGGGGRRLFRKVCWS